jgi:hypothetical protein
MKTTKTLASKLIATSVAVIGMLATTACANRTWYNPNVSQEQANRDTAYCRMQAIAGSGLAIDYASAMMAGMREAQIESLCFQSKGYYMVEKQG